MEHQYVQNQNDAMEIDLVKLVCTLLRKWKVIVLSALVCALLAVGYVAVSQTPAAIDEQVVESYTASMSVYYLDAYLELAAATNHSMEAYLAGDLKTLAVSRTVLEGVIDDLGLEMGYAELAKNVTAEIVASTHILTLSVVGEDAQQAQEIAEALQVRFCDYVVQVMAITAPVVLEDVTVVEQEAAEEVAVEQSGTSLIMGMLIGAVIGFVLSIGCILVCPFVFDFGKSVQKAMKKEA